MIGETIKDFKLTQRLGRGGMGEVWAAEQQIIKTKVAIKLLLEHISTDKQHVQRFFNEAIAVSRIKHAGIVRIFDVGFHAGRAFLIMEFLEGETLAGRIARAGRLPIGQIADVGRQAASILEATHAEGITHRDLKPDNIFLVPDAEFASKERVKILDFGIAKLHTGTGGTGMTATGGSMGTPAYMAPEQWNDAAKADARADTYSLGCLMFEMCCGRPPFPATSIGEACTKHLTEVPPRMRALVPELPAELDDAIARMLAKVPAERPAMRELGAMFARIASTARGALDPTLLPASESARISEQAAQTSAAETTLGGAASSRDADVPRTSKKWFLAAASALVAIGGVVVFVATRGDRKPDPATQPPAPPVPADAATEPAKRAAVANAWIRIAPPAKSYLLGVDDKAPAEVVGFRAARGIATPAHPYELQQHEVTWSEIDPWLAAKGTKLEPPRWAMDPKARAGLPATGIAWPRAQAYCQSIGGSLPTEEQWEYAARGPERHANPWGDDPLDRQVTRAFAGADATPSPVMTSAQDHTADQIHDLIGNVQEWTLGLWREDRPGKDESFVQRGETTVRAVRGFPLAALAPAVIQHEGAAYREQLCATGPCADKARPLLVYIGFRCARPVDK